MISHRKPPRLLLIAVAVLAAAALLLVAAERLATRFYLAEGLSRAGTALRLTVNVLDGHLRRYEALPELLAENHDVVRLVSEPADLGHRAAMNRWLKETNGVLQSSDIYVINLKGYTIAASNFDRTDSFIGQNFSYRPYFTDAAKGGKGRFFALGTTSGVRGYYFAAPIRDPGGAIAGVIAFKLALDHIEETWRSAEHRIIVSDPEGIIFMSSDPRWLYSGLLPLTAERMDVLETSRRYADADLTPLPHEIDSEQGYRLMSLTANDGLHHEYIEQSQVMPDAGWTVRVLLDTAYLRAQVRIVLTATALLICLAGFAAVLVMQRRKALAERLAMQAQARAELERRVEARTADLARVNSQIEAEIAERRLTEQELRRTQADLVQAGKLAALGQMSAALSHEINQPLAAARNYADSAAILIDRGDMARARENICADPVADRPHGDDRQAPAQRRAKAQRAAAGHRSAAGAGGDRWSVLAAKACIRGRRPSRSTCLTTSRRCAASPSACSRCSSTSCPMRPMRWKGARTAACSISAVRNERQGSAAHPRPRTRRSGRHRRPHLRSVLHDQAGRLGPWPRPVDFLQHHEGLRRRPVGCERSRRRRGVHAAP